MQNHKRWIVASALLAACSATTGVAQTNTYNAHGTSCQPGFNVSGQTAYGEPGIGNFSTSAEARVFCPVSRAELHTNVWPTTKVTLGDLSYIDDSGTIPFWCYMWLVENNGATYWSVKLYTCSAPSLGCYDSTTEFIGSGVLWWSNPFGQDRFFNGPTIGYSCNIPRIENGRASWIQSYLTYTHPSAY